MKTMKKRISQLFGLVAVGTALMAGVSCSNDTEELMGQPGARNYLLHFPAHGFMRLINHNIMTITGQLPRRG